VERGGVEHFGFTTDELAVMAGSHGGERIHLERVVRILGKIDAPADALMCGAQMPLDAGAAAELRASRQSPTVLHCNCSGKHAGMLALARLLGASLDDYINPDHPAQVAIRECLLDVLQLEPDTIGIGMDGCSAPAYAVPLSSMGRAFGLLGSVDLAPEPHRDALRRIGEAMRSYPELVGGTSGRVDTELMRLGRGLVAKSGAEGYFCVGHADGIGLALKIVDGDPTARARNLAIAMAVRSAGWIEDRELAGPLGEFGPVRPSHNLAGRHTGDVRPAAALLNDYR
jgi:L-asparaginase II